MIEHLKENKNHIYQSSTEGVHIEVIPTYVEQKSSPENDYYFFAYQVKITNSLPAPLQLINRHWIIRDGARRERYINGEGVVGQRPVIESGDSFEYQSFCPLSTATGNMRGKFEFQNEAGERFWRPIPLFFFRRPESFLQ